MPTRNIALRLSYDGTDFVGSQWQNNGRTVQGEIEGAWEQLTEKDVLEHCKQALTGYKRPKYVEFRTELPKTNVGKILRRALRDEKKAA